MTSDQTSRKIGSRMQSVPGTLGRWLLYLVYGLFFVALFLYLRFPTQQFKAFYTDLVNQYLPGYETSIESLHYQFPLTLVARNLQLQNTNKGAEPLAIQQLAITPDLTAPGKDFSLSISAFGGTHQADLAIDHTDDIFTLSKIEINGLDLAKLSWLKAQTGRTITGLFTAQGSYSGQLGQDMSLGIGKGSAQIKNGTFSLLYPILSLTSIDIDKSEILFSLEDQKILLSKGTFTSKEIEGTLTGQISALASPVAAMQFDMTGTLTPSPALIKKSGQAGGQAQSLLLKLQQNHAALPFHLKGTIGKPAFLFDS